MRRVQGNSAWSMPIMKRAAVVALLRLDPRDLWRNPVIFLTEVAAILTTIFLAHGLATGASDGTAQTAAIAFWLWATVLFSTFSEALAEGRGRAQAQSLRSSRQSSSARLLRATFDGVVREDLENTPSEMVEAARLEPGDAVLVLAGESIPADGEVVHGAATVDESAVTGESAPVIREAGGDRSAVTGGTRVLSDRIVVRITAAPGSGFIDRMIAMVESARRQKTPNEIGLSILLAALTIVFLMVSATLLPLSVFAAAVAGSGVPVTVPVLVALFVCLAPTTIGGLLPAIGIAGMDRLLRRNVVAMSGRAVEAAGDVDVLLLDKTGTITFGNRQAVAFLAAPGVVERDLADAAQLASLTDETPEGRSIVVLAKVRFNLRAHADSGMVHPHEMRFVPFTARTRMSGVDLAGRSIRKGAVDAMRAWCGEHGAAMAPEVERDVAEIARTGGTPLVVADTTRVLGVVHLKDIVKGGIKERFDLLRRSGIKTVMITGDNPITAGAIAAEAGVDSFLAEATPENKLTLIREHQAEGRLVAMMGDGTNDAPALAQADVAVAMNTGTQPAREAANMIDLDSDPTKLLEIVEVGKQLLMTRGALTTFSIANDVAKYFAIIPAAFVGIYPGLAVLDVLDLEHPILSAVVFNALVILALVPLALRGVRYRPQPAATLLGRNLLIYGLGGLVAPFVGIKLLDLVITAVA